MVYTDFNIEEAKNWLKAHLSEERYNHSIGTMETAEELAEMYHLDTEKAKIAGLMHDCAKCFPNDKLLKIIHDELTDIQDCELVNYKTLHAPVSAYIAEKEFGITDPEILSAIRWHTLGKVEMSDFEKIIFLADKIEKNTRDEEFRNECMALVTLKNGLTLAMFRCYQETLKSLVDRKLAICHMTISVYNDLLASSKMIEKE